MPHAGTANHSPNTRYSAYYRVRRYRPNNPYEGDPRWAHGTRDMNDRLGDSSAASFDYSSYNPYQMTIDPILKKTYSLGWYRPGEPAPMLLYQVPWNAEAAAAQAGVMTGLFFLVP